MSQIPDRDLHYNEGDKNESIERDNSDGSLRCPLFVQDTDEMIDEDGNLWICWVDEEEWKKEQIARQKAVRISRIFCALEAIATSSEDAPIVTDTLIGMPSETKTAGIASVPSTGFLTATSTPSTEEYFPLPAVLDPEPDNFIPVVSTGEEHPRPLSEIFVFGGYDYDTAVEDHHYDLEDEDEDDTRRLFSQGFHYNTEVEDEDDDEEESDSDDEGNDDSDDDSGNCNDDNLDTDTENEDRDDSEGGCNLHSEPEDNDESLNPDTVEATPSIPLNNTLAIASNQGPVEKFTDTAWDLIGKTLFTTGVCVWKIVPEKLKDKLKARFADHLASGAGSPSTVVEQEAHSQEEENNNISENDAAVPHDGHGVDYSDYLACMVYLNYSNYPDYPDEMNDDSFQDEEEETSGFGKEVLAYAKARNRRIRILSGMDARGQVVHSCEDACKDHDNILVPLPVDDDGEYKEEDKDDDDDDENDDDLEEEEEEDEDGDDDDGDNGEDDGGYNTDLEEDDDENEVVTEWIVDDDEDELITEWIDNDNDIGAERLAWLAYGEDEDEDEDTEEEYEEYEDIEDEEEDEQELDQTLPARFYRIVIKAWDFLIEELGNEWALANRTTCYRYINKIWRRWVVHARMRGGREDIWGENPDLWEGELEFVERCPCDLRTSKYSRRRYGGRFGGFRLLFYRG
ncbi:uncharacterized protein EAE97_005232 [Botrytis byssoidea]|uniref:Uncharacterized protein n=1 Tax=Botrytis byssoidea TaxID=139641 RepID=A0A9P5IK34_9HELO|nr:uncharacterized protein EAE97_005232 [Botrytis byssoidea]KAF7944599.1 hypothetical protein EAE97_005232 [Botrytis byssoidea]